MRCHSFDSFFQNFANKTKLDIVFALKEASLSVNELVRKTDLEQSKISHNLKKLTQCNVLTVKKQGKQRIYSLNKDTVLPMLQLVEKHVQNYCGRNCPKK